MKELINKYGKSFKPIAIDIKEPPCSKCLYFNPRIKTTQTGDYDGIVICSKIGEMYNDFSCFVASEKRCEERCNNHEKSTLDLLMIDVVDLKELHSKEHLEHIKVNSLDSIRHSLDRLHKRIDDLINSNDLLDKDY